MAFDRLVELVIGTNPLYGTGLAMDGLDVEFNITRSRAFSDNTAEFKIFNAKEETRTKVLKKGNNIVFKTGYSDQGDPFTIFVGNIVEATSIKEFPNWVTTIKAATMQSSNQTIENTYITFSYSNDTMIERPLQELASALGLTIIGLENAQLILLDNGMVFSGPVKMGLKYVQDILKVHNVGMYIDNQEIVLYQLNSKSSNYSVVYLDLESGLLNAHDITPEFNSQLPQPQPKRIQFESLLISKLQPNGLVKIVHPKINGLFVLDKIQFEGNNFGGECKCVCEATE